MKPIFVLTAGAAAVVSVALQGQFRYLDQAGDLTVRGKSGRIVRVQGPAYDFTLTGTVEVRSKAEGLTLTAGAVRLKASPNKATPKIHEVRTATATGSLTVVKTSAQGQSTMRGSKGDYTARAADALLNVAGPVTLTNTDSAKRESMVATGSSLVATLAKGARAADPLRTATLRGGVRVVVHRSASGNQAASRLVARASQMVLDHTRRPGRLTLTGSVTITSEELGTIENVNRAVVTLNEEGQWTDVEVQG